MPATWRLLPRIEVMMFCLAGFFGQAGMDLAPQKKARVTVGNGGRSALSIAL